MNWAFWTSTHASALPVPELARLWMWLGWSVVLAALLLAVSNALSGRRENPGRPAFRSWLGTSKNRRERFECKADGAQRPRHIKEIGEEASTAQRSNRAAQQVFRGAWLVAALAVLWCALPGTLSPAYWLGLAFQSPSALTVALCLLSLIGHLTGTAGRETTPARRIRPHIVCATGLGLLLGWILLLDTLALLPVQFYVLGWSPAAVAVTFLVCTLLTLPGWLQSGTPMERWALPSVLLVFVALRLPSGNLWDALLDPCLWITLHGYALRAMVRWLRSNK